MKKYIITILIINLFLLFLMKTPIGASSTSSNMTSSMSFWNTQQKGTNFFNEKETQARYKSAKELGISFVRLSPNKWSSPIPQTKKGDFLIGSRNKPNIIPPQEDIAVLKDVLDKAQRENVKIILTMISLPYSRWAQHNNKVEDRRIWHSFEDQNKALEFWVNLAKEIKDHPALVGYNIRNEPSPERGKIKLDDWYTQSYEAWQEQVKGTPQDLNLFNKKMVQAIRKIDKNIPIIIEGGYYATAWSFKILEPVDDTNVLYSFHNYEPFAYTNFRNGGKYTYPGQAPLGELSFDETSSSSKTAKLITWNKDELEKFLQPVKDFQKKYNIPNNRIIVSEFGVARKNQGAGKYLEDLITIFNNNQWHWAFYSYREDNWDAMDYELGIQNPPYNYWEDIEKGKVPNYAKVKDKSLINIIKKGLQKQ